MKVYTKGGDKGTTSLVGGERTGKDDLRVEAYGTVDELSAFLALLRDEMAAEKGMDAYRENLRLVQNTLMNVEALLAMGAEGSAKVADVSEAETELLEGWIDAMGESLEPIARFTIPGGHRLVSLAHVCRTVCRRAERAAVRAGGQYNISHNALVYLNRLSDYLYQLTRALTADLHAEEVLWEPPKAR